MSGFVFFIAIYLLSDFIAAILNLPIPGAIIGLILVLSMLCIRGRVDAPIKEAADILLRYLALMLVPIGVGVIKLINPAPAGIWRLELALVLALMLGALGTAKIMQLLLKFRKSAEAALTVETPS